MQAEQQSPKRVRRQPQRARAQELNYTCSSISAHRTHAAQTHQDARGERECTRVAARPADRVHARAASRRPRAQIFIKTLTGRKQAMTFEPTDEVLQIKRQLQEKEGIQVDQIRLIYSGKQLADDKPLEFYNIQAGGTIHMVLQLRGGGAP